MDLIRKSQRNANKSKQAQQYSEFCHFCYCLLIYVRVDLQRENDGREEKTAKIHFVNIKIHRFSKKREGEHTQKCSIKCYAGLAAVIQMIYGKF